MELIHLDFLTLGAKSGDTKSTNILVVTDHFTKYAHAYITSKQTAIVVAPTLWKTSWYTMDGQRKFLLIKDNLLKIIYFKNYVIWLR